MDLKTSNREQAILKAIGRLVAGRPIIAESNDLSDQNLWKEANCSKATLYRYKSAADRWRDAKCRAVLSAIDSIQARLASGDRSKVTLPDLLAVAKIEPKAFHNMGDEVHQRWRAVLEQTRNQPSGEVATRGRGEILHAYAAKIFGLTCAIEQRDKLLAKQSVEIAQLKEQIARLSMPRGLRQPYDP